MRLNLAHPLTSPLTRAITQAGAGGGFDPATLFASGEQGAWYDPSDLSTLFQGSIGTTPVTAVEQPVGLVLDKRLGLERGAEDITNGEFESGAGWSLAAGWSISSGNLLASAVASGSSASRGSEVLANAWYAVEIDVTSISSGGLKVSVGGTDSPTISIAGKYTYILRTTATNTAVQAQGAGATFVVASVSAKEIPGNHVIQPTTAQKLVLKESGAYSYLNLDRVDDNMTAAAGGGGTTGIIVCAAIRAGGAGNARTIWSDRGTNTGYRLSIDASNQLVLSAGNGSAHTEVVGPTITAGTDYVVTGWHDGTNLNVRVNAGATTSAAFGTATAGTTGFTIGKDNGAASGYYGERIYEIVYRKNDASSAGDRTSLITYMAAQAGITL